MKRSSNLILIIIQGILFTYLILGNISHFQIGLADNGDFSRIMSWFTSKPSGFIENWPPSNSPDYNTRFFKYWLPYWELDFPMEGSVISSVIFLWVPGIFINYFFVSNRTLFLPLISLLPRMILLIYLILLFKWINQHPKKIFLSIAIGGLYVLMFTTTDYLAYFNSFYQETGSIIYYLSFLLTIILMVTYPNRRIYYWLMVISVILFVSSKASNLYLGIMVGGAIIIFMVHKKKILSHLLIGLVLILSSIIFSYKFTANETMREFTAHSSLLYGSIPLSDNPIRLLEKLDLLQVIGCLDVDPHSENGINCVKKFNDQISFETTIKSILLEPKIILQQLAMGAKNIQIINLNYLGKTSLHDQMDYRIKRMNVWSDIKTTVFPQGAEYFISLLLMGIMFLYKIHTKNYFERSLATIGFISAIISFLDLYIAFFGDGKRELIKHLLMANFSYDLCLISFIALFVIAISNIIPLRFGNLK